MADTNREAQERIIAASLKNHEARVEVLVMIDRLTDVYKQLNNRVIDLRDRLVRVENDAETTIVQLQQRLDVLEKARVDAAIEQIAPAVHVNHHEPFIRGKRVRDLTLEEASMILSHEGGDDHYNDVGRNSMMLVYGYIMEMLNRYRGLK